jgi:hypothetical protein
MPGFDGTGPMGMGPMTGRGQGYCILEIKEESGLRLNNTRPMKRSDNPTPSLKIPVERRKKAMMSLQPFFYGPIKSCRKRRITYDYRSELQRKRSGFTN